MNLSHVPAGATVTRIYYAIPSHCGIGDEYPTFRAAAEAAYAKGQAIRDRIENDPASKPYYSEESLESLAKTASVVDLRWTLSWPVDPRVGGASGLDTTVERMNVRHLTPAHWERVERMTSARAL